MNEYRSNYKSEINIIKNIVCSYYKIPVDIIDKKTRLRNIVQARQIATYFSRLLTQYSLSVIGSQIGSKDHATVLHSCKNINNLIDTDKNISGQIKELENIIKIRLKLCYDNSDYKTHELKVWTEVYEFVHEEIKSFEIRINDRDFKAGDLLILKEYDPQTNKYTGRECERWVSYILEGGKFGIQKGFVAMSLTKI